MKEDELTRPSMALPKGTLVGGKYRIEETIGSGGMGTVYRAQHEAIGRTVALKMLNPVLKAEPDVVKRFQREAKAAGLIGHPGIVDVYDLDETEQGVPFIVMEYLEGDTFASALADQRNPLSVTQIVLIVAEILDALHAAHLAGIVHRDLKPSNIFLTKDGRTRVFDFGVSKFAEYINKTILTRTGFSVGTALFMAPEQMREARSALPASDLFSIGAILYFAFCGQAPFDSKVYTHVVVKTMTEPHPPLGPRVPDLPNGLVHVVDRLLAKNPNDRPSSALKAKSMLLTAIGLGDELPGFDDESSSESTNTNTKPRARDE